jgi:DNA-binding winged helix-turn-helix (wHTH) protein
MATKNTTPPSRIAGTACGMNLLDTPLLNKGEAVGINNRTAPQFWDVRDRRVGQVAKSSWKCGDTASPGDLFQNVASQLVPVFRAFGCALPFAEELAEKVTGEVKARVREVLRRPGLGASWVSGLIQVGDLRLDLERHMFWRGDDEIHLSPKEFALLAVMMKNTDVLLPHVKLLRSVWGLEYGGELEYLRTYVYALRRKIEKDAANPEYIVSEPGIGYRFHSPASVARRLQGTGLPDLGYVVPPTIPMGELGGAL